MTVDLGDSVFSAELMGAAIKQLSEDRAVGFGYAISRDGEPNVATGGGGRARTGSDTPVKSFTSQTELEVSSVSKTITATAILHMLQSKPGGVFLGLKSRLIDYLPSSWDPGSNIQHITLRHLLTHTSGFPETNNRIRVEFGSYPNNTIDNLKDLVEAGLPAPTVPADDVFDRPRWGYMYNNANFTLLARVVLPKLIDPSMNLTSSGQLADFATGNVYEEYVRTEILSPLGITNAQMEPTEDDPALGYKFSIKDDGVSMTDLTPLGGAFGWKLTARELSRFLNGIQHDNQILSVATRITRDNQELGWFRGEDQWGTRFAHDGSTTTDGGKFRSRITAFPGDIQVAYLMNSEAEFLPGGGMGAMLQTAYVNGWSDLVVRGTADFDTFVVEMVEDHGEPAISVSLNGQEQFRRWVKGFKSLRLEGAFGNDEFSIRGWDPAVKLDLRGQLGNDFVRLDGGGNLEPFSNMIFDGGPGSDLLVANDSMNPYSASLLSRTYAISDNAISRHRGVLNFPVPVVVQFVDVEKLELDTGSGDDILHVASALSEATRIWTGDGDDLIVLTEVGGNLSGVNGLQVDGKKGTDRLRVFDHKTTIPIGSVGRYELEADRLSRQTVSNITGSSDSMDYEIAFDRVEHLELSTTAMRDVIHVHSLPSESATVFGNAGNDDLLVTPVGKNMERADGLTFNGGDGADTVQVNDQSNPYSIAQANQYRVSATGVSRKTTGFVLPADVNITWSGVEALKVRTGEQKDIVNVVNTAVNSTTIETGAGDDEINGNSATRSMDELDQLMVDGGTGRDALNILDVGNTYDAGAAGGQYTISPESIARLDAHPRLPLTGVPVEIKYVAVEDIELSAGSQANVFNVGGSGSSSVLTLRGNLGVDVFHIDSPAFRTIHVHGDSPLVAPGDRLTVNRSGLYGTGLIPGTYPSGAGGVSMADMKVFYHGIETLERNTNVALPGDVNLDGDVDADDLLNLLANWTGSLSHGVGGKQPSTGDFDGDGDCDASDLLEFLANWTGNL